MSNLGGYQTLTTIAKKFGGPGRFFLAVLCSGGVIFKITEMGGKKIYKMINKKIEDVNKKKMREYTVLKDGIDKQGLKFKIGDKIKVLESADDAILIEKIGDKNNPYFVSIDFLKKIIAFDSQTTSATQNGSDAR